MTKSAKAFTRHWIGALRFCTALLALAGTAQLALTTRAAAGTVRPMVWTGSPANRVDIVILGDGYRSIEMPKFSQDAYNLANKLLSEPPFSNYRKYFNVRRIETPSATSGASHTGSPGNTYYGAYFNCFGVERLLCIDNARVTSELNATLPPSQRDIVLVVVNDATYGGSGGQYAVTSTHPQAPEIAIHELGHSFGRLDDEYVDTFNCGRYTTPVGGFNVTKTTTRSSIPWVKWIPASTIVPTPPTGTGVGLYEGAFYCATGWYRPTPDSKMQSLGVPFYQVNSEQLVRSIYGVVSTLDAIAPAPGALRIAPGTTRTFSARKIVPGASWLTTLWRLGGVVISTTDKVTVTSAQLGGANKLLTLTVHDKTSLVRNDPSSLLFDRFFWTLTP